MAKFKIGADIEKIDEVKELIVNLVNSMEEKFTQAFLLKLTKKYVQGSPLKLTDNRVEKLVELTLYDLQMSNKVVCENGIFVRLNIKKAKKSFVSIENTL